MLTSFRRCFSSLGVFLLSSMSLRISTSFDTSSVSFAAAVSPASSSSFFGIKWLPARPPLLAQPLPGRLGSCFFGSLHWGGARVARSSPRFNKSVLDFGPQRFFALNLLPPNPQTPKPTKLPKLESGRLVFCPERCPSVQRAAKPSGTEVLDHSPIQIIALGVALPRAKAVHLQSTLQGVQEEEYPKPEEIQCERHPGIVIKSNENVTPTEDSSFSDTHIARKRDLCRRSVAL